MKETLHSYSKYLIIGGIVGVLTIAGREIIALLLPEDTPFYYGLSVALIYTFGILASYWGHKSYSFSHVSMEDHDSKKSLLTFTVVAIIGLISTTLLSILIRYSLPTIESLEIIIPAFSFAVATLLSSVLTFILNKKFTFSETKYSTD